MANNTNQIIAALVARLVRAEASEKALLDMLSENGVIDKETFGKKLEETFSNMSLKATNEILGLSDEELRSSFKGNDK